MSVEAHDSAEPHRAFRNLRASLPRTGRADQNRPFYLKFIDSLRHLPSANLRRDYPGVLIGLIFEVAGIAILLPISPIQRIPSDFAWVLIGTGLGTIVTDMLGAADRMRAEVRHHEALQRVLGALSGTPRQALRFGTALAELMTNPQWPHPDEKRFLEANAAVLGVEAPLAEVLCDGAVRDEEAVERFVLYARGARGKEVEDGLKIGYRLERMAEDLEARPEQSSSDLSRKSDILKAMKPRLLRCFPVDAEFAIWIDRNLTVSEILPENRVAVIRQSLKMLWQSRHLRENLDPCECLDHPCVKRKDYQDKFQKFSDARHSIFPKDFAEKLSTYEMGRRSEDFEELRLF